MRQIRLLILGLSLTLIACGNDTPTFSLLQQSRKFVQEGDEVNNKLDILWVIDNSGSMNSSQVNLTTNFNSFISDFITKGYDFNMAVTTTEAYCSALSGSPCNGTPSDSAFVGGVVSNTTPNLINTLLGNILVGTGGTGDERAFSSFREALNNSLNSGFLRPDSFLSVIIVSDEDDFSHDTDPYNFIYGIYSGDPNTSSDDSTDPDYNLLDNISTYVDYLDTLTGYDGTNNRRYNVNSIQIANETCRASLGFWAQIGFRMGDLVDATGGIKGDICGDFSDSLSSISSKILELSTQFYLDREPKVETISVSINGVMVPEASTNPGPSVGGWTYNTTELSIVFSGDFLPAQGSEIIIDFDPISFN